MTAPSNVRVLIIDDHDVIRRTLRVVLGTLAVTDVQEAASADDAERLLRQDPPFDVIICDLNLPGRDGIELLRSMPELVGQSAVVLLSGEPERVLQSVAAMGRAAGLHVAAAISKPPTVPNMRLALELAAQSAPARRAPAPEVTLTAEQLEEVFAGGLRTYYQPKVDAKTGALRGFEALLRGRHPKLGAVPPLAIVRAAVQAERVGYLTLSVLQDAFATAARLRAEGANIDMAINLDAAALKHLNLPDIVGRLATDLMVPEGAITFELTEEHIFDDYVVALDVTTRLRLKRFHLSIDDFGTGVSGLRQLQDLPFTELKIDRAFVMNCHERPLSRAIIEATLGLARAFELQTVAEGVERQEEWDVLRTLGVDLIQGYLVAKPMPEAQLDDWMGEWAARSTNLPG